MAYSFGKINETLKRTVQIAWDVSVYADFVVGEGKNFE